MKQLFLEEGISMKKFLFALMGLVVGVPFAAADNIKMVTYFPVPYASYGDLSVTGTCDVGLTGSCRLDAGNGLTISRDSSITSSMSPALNRGKLIVTQGELSLDSSTSNSKIQAGRLMAGDPSSVDSSFGKAEFSHNLSVGSINSNKLRTLTAQRNAKLTDLYLFSSANDHRFPVCDATSNAISWQNLTIDGTSGVFLTCGAGENNCEDFYSAEEETTKSAVDTCDGSTSSKFTCSGEAKDCTDVFTKIYTNRKLASSVIDNVINSGKNPAGTVGGIFGGGTSGGSTGTGTPAITYYKRTVRCCAN